MLRDTIKDINYFNSYINYENNRKEKFQEMLDKLPTEKRETCIIYIASALRNKLIAQYSRGDSKADIRATFAEYMDFISETTIDSYEEYTTILSWIILLDYGRNQLKFLKKVPSVEDGLTQVLESYINDSVLIANTDSLIFSDEYKPFFDYVLNRTDIQSFIYFLKNDWYSSCREKYWFDSHKSKEDVYAGYWCWLAGAIVKIRNDNIQSNIKYFPYDML